MTNADNLSQVTPIPSAEEKAVAHLIELMEENVLLRSEIAGLKYKIELLELEKP